MGGRACHPWRGSFPRSGTLRRGRFTAIRSLQICAPEAARPSLHLRAPVLKPAARAVHARPWESPSFCRARGRRPSIFSPRSAVVDDLLSPVISNLFPVERSRRRHRPSVCHAQVDLFFLRLADLLRRATFLLRHGSPPRESLSSSDLPTGRHLTAGEWIRGGLHIGSLGSPTQVAREHVCTRGGRGKKREGLHDDSQVAGKGRRHVPKAKRLRSDDASTRVPLGGAQGWAAEAGGDDDDDFMSDEDQGQATASGVRKSGWQRQSDHNASKRLMTPPPEMKQVRARDRRTDDAHVDDVGDDDDEPLERRLLRSHTAATPPPVALGHAIAGEKAVTGRLSATTAAPRPRNTAAEGGSVQRGGGGVVAAHAGAVGVEAAGAAGAVAGVSGSAPPVPAARKEGAVVAMARDDVRGEKRNDQEGGEAGSSRPRRGVLTNDLIDRVVLWVDDKPFWTTGEGRRLYNIVHETRAACDPSERCDAQIQHADSQDRRPVAAATSDLPCLDSGEHRSPRIARLGFQVWEPPEGLQSCIPVRPGVRGDGHSVSYVVARSGATSLARPFAHTQYISPWTCHCGSRA
ncbi:hypothetical protein CBR_g41784 [Chara braunii]|uniref:Uncharacterized protein n=1 Tax=Chara braunii TaxID=69332 RepID=A0A388LWM0_CHABU|nr:hypothetical protein CBR_g41784 [Chara braunii]|eukprot:GBG86720.1 hypothetical protein CBR_g41784 [Chara braunii]